MEIVCLRDDDGNCVVDARWFVMNVGRVCAVDGAEERRMSLAQQDGTQQKFVPCTFSSSL